MPKLQVVDNYYLVDEHPPLYRKNGSLDPGTYGGRFFFPKNGFEGCVAKRIVDDGDGDGDGDGDDDDDDDDDDVDDDDDDDDDDYDAGDDAGDDENFFHRYILKQFAFNQHLNQGFGDKVSTPSPSWCVKNFLPKTHRPPMQSNIVDIGSMERFYIYLHLWLIFMVNVGVCIYSHMDPVGVWADPKSLGFTLNLRFPTAVQGHDFPQVQMKNCQKPRKITPPKANMSPKKGTISVGSTSSNHWFWGDSH